MSDAKTAKTVSDELREAAARAREHLLPHVIAEVLPETAIVALCGSIHEESAVMCRNCVMFDVKDRVLARLVVTLLNAREPLASWLEDAERRYETAMEEIECTACGEAGACTHPAEAEFCQGCEEPTPCRCITPALAVARVLNGTTPQEVAAAGVAFSEGAP
ncbi:hypothetical protein [Streptomyces sp.]|uniref:hypothetical protein n=1 Tax=Streptomyces sp. TaxID=1931 RepID=UPI002F95F0BE